MHLCSCVLKSAGTNGTSGGIAESSKSRRAAANKKQGGQGDSVKTHDMTTLHQTTLLLILHSTLSLSPIDTDHSCYFNNRIYQQELRSEEEHSLVNLIDITTEGGCEAQKLISTCNEFSALEFKTSRQPLTQCGWCTKGGTSMCVSCGVAVHTKEMEGYICAPDTKACKNDQSQGQSKPAVTPLPEETAPKPDPTPPCATASNAVPCELGSKQGSTPFSNLRTNTVKTKENDPTLPAPDPTPNDSASTKKATDLTELNTPEKDLNTVTPEERKGKEEQNKFDEPIRYGSAVVPWNLYQFCERLVDQIFEPEMSDELSKGESPPNDFTSVCLGMFGNVCLPQCRTLANLYDEASRPGADEVGGKDGNNNVWDKVNDKNDQGRWDTSRNIASAGEFSGKKEDYGPTFVRNERKLVYQMTQSDCVKCLKEDDCTPDCLLNGDCSGENDEDISIDKTMNGIE